MRLRILLVAIAAAALAVPVAHAKGKPPTTGPDCKPNVGVVLRGSLLAVDSTMDGSNPEYSIRIHVTKANDHGTRFVNTDVTLTVTSKTKIRRNGPAKLTDLVLAPTADVIKVMAKGCKAELNNPQATPVLVARHIKAKPPAPTP